MSRSVPLPKQGGVRLLVVNPNTNPEVTALVAATARDAAAPDTELTILNPEAGPLAIETPQDRAAAIPNVLRLLRAQRPGAFDGYVLACFDDIAVPEARALTGAPVCDICEAGIRAGIARGGRFAIVTTVHAAVPTIQRFVTRHGAAERCTVRAAGVGVSAAASLPAEVETRLLDTMRLALKEDGADAILLGSGALAGQAAHFADRLGVPVIDGVAAAVIRIEGLVRARRLLT